MTAVTDATILSLLDSVRKHPSEGLIETGDAWGLGGSLRIDKRYPAFTDGFERDLRPGSHFYKRWFDFSDTGQRGWAIIFQVFPPSEPGLKAEYFAAWVPPERERDADRWIEFLNAEIQDRLHGARGAVIDSGSAEPQP